jgi:CheY-like chemotaxis protein
MKSTPASPRRRVLVADDLFDAADSLALLLRLDGHEVYVAYDGEQALDAARQVLPEIALIDIDMPRLTGYDVARRIREQPWGASMYLIAVTGWAQDHDLEVAAEAGFDVHVVKPVDPDTLKRVIEAKPETIPS